MTPSFIHSTSYTFSAIPSTSMVRRDDSLNLYETNNDKVNAALTDHHRDRRASNEIADGSRKRAYFAEYYIVYIYIYI